MRGGGSVVNISVGGNRAISDNKEGVKGQTPRRTAVVVASQTGENSTWLEEYFPQWEKNIYKVDDQNAPLTVPVNKGRESMVYLT